MKTNTTQDIAIDFARQALSAINGQLAVEIVRNGFSLKQVKKQRQKVGRIIAADTSDPRFFSESFTISSKKHPVARVIMVVQWTPKGFHIERNSDATAAAVAKNPMHGVKNGVAPIFVGEMSERDIEIEARATEYEKKEYEEITKASGIC